MKRTGPWLFVTLLLVGCGISTFAQRTTNIEASAVVPRLVNFSGSLTDANGKPEGGMVGVTFSLYRDSERGAPLWVETQNVQADKNGHYSVMLGSNSGSGLPSELFASGEARWLGVQPQGQAEQPRVLLMSVPYALKALDAQTLGGRPASAFLAATGASGSTPAGNVTGSGTKNFIPRWTSASQIGNSNIFENAGEVGIATSTPAARLDVNGATDIRNTLTLFPSGTNPAVKISGSAFGITSAGKVNFISGQTFPGTGTITGVTAGSGLTGGGNSGKVTLGLINSCSSGQTLQWNGTKWVCSNAGSGTITGVTAQAPITGGGTSGNVNIGLTNSCSSGQVLQWNGSKWACASVGTGTITGVAAGTDLTGGGSSGNVTLNLDTTKVPQLVAANSFTNNNAITGAGSGFALTVTQPTAINGQSGTPALLSVGADADFNGLGTGGVGVTAEGGGGGSENISGAGGNAINAFGGSAGNGNGGIGVSAAGGFGTGGDLVETGIGGAGVVATGGDSELFSGGDGIDATGGAGGQGENFASASGNGVVGTGGQGGFQEADGSGGFFTGGTAGGFGGIGIEVFAGSDLAGFFEGDVVITGNLSAGSKNFKIDHPLDPANKYLSHASIESSEMINIYTGNATTDAQGDAEVKLPDWFEAVNTDFRYQLTVIGQFAQAIVSSRVSNHQFGIKTDKPNVDVSWQITGVRQDAYAKAHPLVVEQDKNARERGFYLHPELYGAPAEKGIAWSHHPDTMRRVKTMQQRPKGAVPRQRTAAPGHATVVNAKARK
jgi:trimeric autotransporter adhesin